MRNDIIEYTVQQKLKPLKWYKKLNTRQGRLEAGAFLVEGHRAIEQITLSHPKEILEIITVGTLSHAYDRYPVRTVNRNQFSAISSTKTPQGVLAVVRLPADTYSDKLPSITGHKILLLEDIQDPGNVGTLIRTAAAFDFDGIILTERCSDPVSPKCVQSTAGSILSTWIRKTIQYIELAQKLKENGFMLEAADLNGSDDPGIIASCNKLVLALGNEASGLSPAILKMADHRVMIRIKRTKAQSLNVAACGAVCMYLSSMRSPSSNF